MGPQDILVEATTGVFMSFACKMDGRNEVAFLMSALYISRSVDNHSGRLKLYQKSKGIAPTRMQIGAYPAGNSAVELS